MSGPARGDRTCALDMPFVPPRRSASRTRTRSALVHGSIVWAFLVCTSASSLEIDCDVVPAVARASSERCEATRVRVLSASVDDMEDICTSARDTLAFLAGLGLATDFDVSVEVVAQLPTTIGPDCYLLAERRVLLLSYDVLASAESYLGLPIDRFMYRALVAHEITHAVSDLNVETTRLSTLAMEYVSAVVSLATMDPDRRRRLLDSIPGPGFTHGSRISLAYYLLDPARFWVNAYRHFIRPEVGAAFIDAVLAGEALNGRDPHTR